MSIQPFHRTSSLPVLQFFRLEFFIQLKLFPDTRHTLSVRIEWDEGRLQVLRSSDRTKLTSQQRAPFVRLLRIRCSRALCNFNSALSTEMAFEQLALVHYREKGEQDRVGVILGYGFFTFQYVPGDFIESLRYYVCIYMNVWSFREPSYIEIGKEIVVDTK